LEVHDAVVIELLTREDVISETGWVDVGEWVLVGVPATKAEIDTPNECHRIVDYNEFLVVSL
jgi:hypothetical protein